MYLWNLKDWNLKKIATFSEIQELKETEIGYFLMLNFENKYRKFLLTDNGGELNFVELGRYNKHFEEMSLVLPTDGTKAKTDVGVVYYRIMQFINNKTIDYSYEEKDIISEEDWKVIIQKLNKGIK